MHGRGPRRPGLRVCRRAIGGRIDWIMRGECAQLVRRVPETSTLTQRSRLCPETCTLHKARSSELQHGWVRCHTMDHNRVGPGQAGVPITMLALAPTLRLVSRDAMRKLGFGSAGNRTVGEALLSDRDRTCYTPQHPVRPHASPLPPSRGAPCRFAPASFSAWGSDKAGRTSAYSPLARCDSARGRTDSSPVEREAAGS